MGENRSSIGQIADIAEFTVDLFAAYDADSNSRVEGDELFILNRKEWDEFCSENEICDGIKRGDVAALISIPETRQKFFQYLPAMVGYWDYNDDGICELPSQPTHAITGMIPELESMPDGKAAMAIGAMRDFWIDFDVFAGRALRSGGMSEEEYVIYKDAIAGYLRTAATNQAPERFMKTLEGLYMKNRELGDVAELIEYTMMPASIQVLYGGLREKPRKGYKNVMLFNRQKNEFEVRAVKAGVEFPEDGNLVPVAVSRNGKRPEVFSDNIMNHVPWLANVGRVGLIQSIRRGQKFLDSKNAMMRIKGLKDVPITNVIPADMLMGIIYTERVWNAMTRAKTREDILKAASYVDIRVALDGQGAYVDDVSGVGATGLVQLMPGSYDDIHQYFPGLLPDSYEETTSNMDASIVAMMLVIERMGEIMANSLRRNEWGPDDLRDLFVGMPTDPNRIGVKALAIAYNQGGLLPSKYVRTKNERLLTTYAKSVSNVMDAI